MSSERARQENASPPSPVSPPPESPRDPEHRSFLVGRRREVDRWAVAYHRTRSDHSRDQVWRLIQPILEHHVRGMCVRGSAAYIVGVDGTMLDLGPERFHQTLSAYNMVLPEILKEFDPSRSTSFCLFFCRCSNRRALKYGRETPYGATRCQMANELRRKGYIDRASPLYWDEAVESVARTPYQRREAAAVLGREYGAGRVTEPPPVGDPEDANKVDCHRILLETGRSPACIGRLPEKEQKAIDEEMDEVECCFRHMAQEHVRAVRQSLLEGLTFAQSGEREGIGEDCARKRYHRALEVLRALWKARSGGGSVVDAARKAYGRRAGDAGAAA